MARRGAQREDLIDIGRAARLAGRNPETIRRWVRSGRLEAQRRGRQLFVARGDVEVMVDSPTMGLADWAARARVEREAVDQVTADGSAAGLVTEDRARRARMTELHARR